MEYKCELDGGVANRFGRFRALPKIYSHSRFERAEAVRRAINTPVQGTGSDLLIGSAFEIDRKLSKAIDLKIVGTVHDSILMDVPEEYVDVAVKEVKSIMTHPEIMDIFGVSFKVPLGVDVAVGAWGKGVEV
jgi:DNA polymerase-1